MAAHEGEKHRHQIDRTEQADAEAKAQGAAGRERAPLQCREPHDRMRGAPGPMDENADPDRARRQQADTKQRQPATLRRFLQPDLEAGKRRRQQDQRGHIQLCQFAEIGVLARQQQWRHRGRDHPGNDVDQEQPWPRPGFRDPAADDGPDRRRQHRDHAADRGGDGVKPGRKQQEDRGEYRRDQNAAGKSLHHAEDKQDRKTAAEGATDGCEGKEGHGRSEQPPQRQDAREQAGQGDRDHLGDQIGGLDPAHRIRGNGERVLDRRQRRRDHLDIEDRHEHAKAHQQEARPCRDGVRPRRRRGPAGCSWSGAQADRQRRRARVPRRESGWRAPRHSAP